MNAPIGIQIECDTSPAYSQKTISVYTTMVLDGAELENLDIAEFFQVLGTSGRVPLFTCGCGDFECGGFNVEVLATPEAWIRRIPFDREQKLPDTIPENPDAPWFGYVSDLRRRAIQVVEYCLSWKSVQEVASKLITSLLSIRDEHPHAAIICGTLGVEISGRIADFSSALSKLAARFEQND